MNVREESPTKGAKAKVGKRNPSVWSVKPKSWVQRRKQKCGKHVFNRITQRGQLWWNDMPKSVCRNKCKRRINTGPPKKGWAKVRTQKQQVYLQKHAYKGEQNSNSYCMLAPLFCSYLFSLGVYLQKPFLPFFNGFVVASYGGLTLSCVPLDFSVCYFKAFSA